MGLNKFTVVICTLLLSVGIFGAGYSVGKGFYLIKKMNRTLTVKGLAEQDVKSDLGVWEINFKEVGSDLVHLNQQVQHDQKIIIAFLKHQGFTDQEMDKTQLKIDDRSTNIYHQANVKSTRDERYTITAGMRVRSEKVELIKQTAQAIDKLLAKNVPLAFDVSELSPNPSYYYTKLDDIRPTMLRDATKSARIIAQQFAKNTTSRLGGIQRANQGVFQVMARDTSAMNANWRSNQYALGSIDKKIRLVTTIEYQLR